MRLLDCILQRGTSRARPGQAMVEFALSIIGFLALVFGLIDTSRAIFAYHGLSQASATLVRDLAIANVTRGVSLESGAPAWPAGVPALLDTAAKASGTGFSTYAPVHATQLCAWYGFTAYDYQFQQGDGTSYEFQSNDPGVACGPVSATQPCQTTAGTQPSSVTLCGAPTLAKPVELHIRLRLAFVPVTSYFIGGRTLNLQQESTQTVLANQ